MNQLAERIIDILEEHLPYEIVMLHVCYAGLLTPSLNDPEKNFLIESFCSQFDRIFYGAKSEAKEFTTTRRRQTLSRWAVIAFNGRQIRSEPVYEKLNAQISHLKYSRERNPANKLNGGRFHKFEGFARQRSQTIVDALPSEHKSTWRNGLAGRAGLYVGS